jgi:DNA-directed RNA polymerase II subunit RPB7
MIHCSYCFEEMFFVKKLRRDILLEPAFLSSKLKESVRRGIHEELEGQCLGKHGYIISILEIEDNDIIPGLIDNDSGCVHVTVFYSAILLRPFKNEVLDTIVVSASDDVREKS